MDVFEVLVWETSIDFTATATTTSKYLVVPLHIAIADYDPCEEGILSMKYETY